MANDYLTWGQFVAEVKKLLPIDANRKGVGATDYLTSLIRQAVIHLQAIIPELRIGHETIYEPTDLVQEGSALRGVKPPDSAIRDVFFYRFNDPDAADYDADKPGTRFPARTCGWGSRFNLVNGVEHVNSEALFCLDPQGYTFYIYPAPPEGECWRLSINWDGVKHEFQDDEQTPFPEMMAMAVATFVKSNTALDAENGTEMSHEWERKFRNSKPLLAATMKEMATA